MGAKFTKELIDGTLVCDPRGGWCAKMGLQDTAETQDWTELIIAAFVSLTGVADDDGAWPAETIASPGVFDRFLFGLKDDDDSKLIGVADTYFMGVASKLTETTSIDTNGELLLRTDAGKSGFSTSNDATVNESTDKAWLYQFSTTVDAVAATNYARFMGLQFVRSNVGTAAETVEMWASANGTTKHTDTSLAALRTLVNSFSTHRFAASSGSLTFNTGAAPYPTPDTWYLRWFGLNSRVRIHSAMFQVNAL